MKRKPWTKKRSITVLESTEMRAMYEDHGYNLTQIAKSYKITAPTVSKYIREAGAVIRKPGKKFKSPLIILKRKE